MLNTSLPDIAIKKLGLAISSMPFIYDPVNMEAALAKPEGGILDNSIMGATITRQDLEESLRDPKAVKLDSTDPNENRFVAPKENSISHYLSNLSVLMRYTREAVSPILKTLHELSKSNLSEDIKAKVDFLLDNLQLKLKPTEA